MIETKEKLGWVGGPEEEGHQNCFTVCRELSKYKIQIGFWKTIFKKIDLRSTSVSRVANNGRFDNLGCYYEIVAMTVKVHVQGDVLLRWLSLVRLPSKYSE